MICDLRFTICLKCAALAFFSCFILQPASLLAQGSLTPPGAPAPAMKSLAQIEPRTPISSVPFNISAPGSYYLTTNVNCTVSNAIVITANGVTLDLSGWTISSTVANAANGGSAILLASGLSDIAIFNGHIRSGVTNNGSGVYSGGGFGYGIYFLGTAPVNVLVSHVSVSGCQYYGLYLDYGDSTVVESCTVRTVGGFGIVASTIKQSSAIDCSGTAIYGDQVADCRGKSTGAGYGIYASVAQNSYGQSTSSSAVYATTAQNCYGYSAYIGVYATIAENCYGSSGSSYGIYAARIATGCEGYSSSGTGLSAFIANSCSGSSLSITHNLNSY